MFCKWMDDEVPECYLSTARLKACARDGFGELLEVQYMHYMCSSSYAKWSYLIILWNNMEVGDKQHESRCSKALLIRTHIRTDLLPFV